MNDENLEVVKQAKLLGVMISDDLKWDKNTEYLVKKAYSRMEFLRKVAEFTKSIEDKREIESLKQRRKKLCKTARPLQKMYED